jgi:hypothetical protein
LAISYLGDAKEASGVAELPVAEFVGKNGDDLVGFRLFNQGVINDNVLLPWQTVKVGVGVRASLASINDKQFLQGEVVGGSQFLNLGLEFALLEGRQLVEQGLDKDGVCGGGEELQAGSKDPEIKDKLVARLLDNLEEGSQNRGHEDNGQQVGLDHIGNKELGRLLVEAKLFLQDKCIVDACGKREKLLDNNEAENKDDGVADFAREPGGSPFEEQVACPGPQLGENVELDKCHVLNLRPETRDNFVLGLCATIRLGLVERFLRDFLGQDGRGLGLLENAVLTEGEEGFKDVLADGKAKDKLLPGEERAIEESREALLSMS